MELLSSHWTIGAVAGLACGVLVTIVVRQLFSGREQREYQHKIAAANAEIIQAIRPSVAEKIIPSPAMLEALFSATARKYGVHSGDLLSRAGFANELIKDIVDNPFLSSQQKVEYCDLLNVMKQPDREPVKREAAPVRRRSEAADPSALLGVTAGLTAFVMLTFFHLRERADFIANGQLLKALPMLAMICIIPIVAFLLVDLFRYLSRPRQDLDEEIGALAAPPAVPPRETNLLENKPAQPAS